MVVLILPLSTKKVLGQISYGSWIKKGPGKERDELSIHPIILNAKYVLLGAILDEGAHAVLARKGVNHVSNGYYHKKQFRDYCRKRLGLNCKWRNHRYGWTIFFIKKDFAHEKYQDELHIIDGLPKASNKSVNFDTKQKEIPKSPLLRAYCDCQRYITVTQKNYLHAEPILCTKCFSFFCVKK